MSDYVGDKFESFCHQADEIKIRHQHLRLVTNKDMVANLYFKNPNSFKMNRSVFINSM